jgi:hypothetical protein
MLFFLLYKGICGISWIAEAELILVSFGYKLPAWHSKRLLFSLGY